MATITPRTPIYLDGPEPHVVAAIREYLAADRRLDAAMDAGLVGRQIADEREAFRAAWATLNAVFPHGTGWYQVDGRWWGRSKRSPFGLELICLDELPPGLRSAM